MNKKLRNIVFIFTFIFVLMVLSSISYAASFKTKVEPKEVKVGDTITITATADNAAGMYNVKISDTSILAVSSGSLSDFLEDESATIKLKAKKAGTVTITTSAEDMTDLDNSKNAVTGGGTYTIKVTDPNANDGGGTENQNPSSASNNAYLSTLGVTPKEYDFSGFKKTTMNYSVTIPYEIDSLKVLYKTADSNAKVKVTGNSGFKVGSDNKITIVVTAQDGKTTETYTIKVTKLAKKEGTTSKPETPTTPEEPKEKSTNAYLSTLGVTPKEYDFSGFKKTNFNYIVTIPYEVDSLKVLYKTADSGAAVKVTGNSGFVVGSNNKITVKVTAEDGKTTKTYTIKVTKLAEVEEKPGNIIDEEIEELFLTSLSIKGVDISPEFAKDTYAYTGVLSDIDTTEVEVKAEANKENANIEISGNTDLVVGENTINIVVKQEDSSLQTVYQVTVTKEAALVTTDTQEVDFISSLIDNIKNYVIIAVIVIVLIIAAVIILIILLRKENQKLENEDTEEYNVYENDENEFKDNKEHNIEKIEEVTNETETKNEGRRNKRREKGRHSM